MFTGIVETIGKIVSVETFGTNKTFWISYLISPQFKIDQSVAHDGVCLTIEEIREGTHRVTAILETLEKTNLHTWKIGGSVNLERSMLMNGRIDGHIVQGHVDTTAICTSIQDAGGSWLYQFEIEARFAPLIIEKGSISVNGTSLTIFNVSKSSFEVAIIPYTYSHTSISDVGAGSVVNIEFDMIGKYVHRLQQLKA